MADVSDSTPLVDTPTTPTPAAAAPYSSPTRLYWWNYAVLAVVALGVAGAFLSSFASLWKAVFFVLTFSLLFYIYDSIVLGAYKPSPDVFPCSFLVTHLGFSWLLAPFLLAILTALLFLALGVAMLLIVMLFAALLSALYPDAMEVLSADLQQFATHAASVFESSALHAAPAAAAAAALSLPAHVARAADARAELDIDTAAVSAGVAKVWDDVVSAGASPAVLAFVLVALACVAVALFVGVGGVGCNALLELIKWKLLKRHKRAPGVASLTVTDVAYFALSGAFYLAVSAVVSTSFGIVPSFLNSLVFCVSALTDVAVLTVSQALVAAAFAEETLLDGEAGLVRKALKTSVLFNFGLSLLRVSPAAAADTDAVLVDGKGVGGMAVPSLVVLILFGGARIGLLYKFGMPFVQRLQNAVAADGERRAAEAEAEAEA